MAVLRRALPLNKWKPTLDNRSHATEPARLGLRRSSGAHALPSWMETCGLVSLEAALSGTPLVGSTFGMNLSTSKAMLGTLTLPMKVALEKLS